MEGAKNSNFKNHDIGEFVRIMVEEWDLDQLMNYAMENLNDFYNKHGDIFEVDYKLFMEDHKAYEDPQIIDSVDPAWVYKDLV